MTEAVVDPGLVEPGLFLPVARSADFTTVCGCGQIYLLSSAIIAAKTSLSQTNSRCLLVQGSRRSHPPSNH